MKTKKTAVVILKFSLKIKIKIFKGPTLSTLIINMVILLLITIIDILTEVIVRKNKHSIMILKNTIMKII